MEMKTVDGREVPVVRAHLDAVLRLQYTQHHYKKELEHIDEEGVERAQEVIRPLAELCGIDIPDSCDAFHWLVSCEGEYQVMKLFKAAIVDDPKQAPSNIAPTGLNKVRQTVTVEEDEDGEWVPVNDENEEQAFNDSIENTIQDSANAGAALKTIPTGVSAFDLGLQLEKDLDAARSWARRFSSDASLTPLGKCPLDGRKQLYGLAEMLAEVEKKYRLTTSDRARIVKALTPMERLPRFEDSPKG